MSCANTTTKKRRASLLYIGRLFCVFPIQKKPLHSREDEKEEKGSKDVWRAQQCLCAYTNMHEKIYM